MLSLVRNQRETDDYWCSAHLPLPIFSLAQDPGSWVVVTRIQGGFSFFSHSFQGIPSQTCPAVYLILDSKSVRLTVKIKQHNYCIDLIDLKKRFLIFHLPEKRTNEK